MRMARGQVFGGAIPSPARAKRERVNCYLSQREEKDGSGCILGTNPFARSD